MSKHTPGPWYPDEFEGISIFHDVKDRRFPICRLEPISEGESEANANLIAAAPDLLSALKDFFKMMDEKILVRNIEHDHKPEWAGLMIGVVTRLKFARDAIAKAEGKA